VRLSDIAEYQGGYAYKSQAFTSFGNNQVVRIGNVKTGCLNLEAAPVYLPDGVAKETKRFQLLLDDIVISQTGTRYKRDYGYPARINVTEKKLFLNQRVGRLRCLLGNSPGYLLAWLQTESFRDFFFSDETGNVNQGNVGASALKNAPVALPPLPEQHEIVRRVEALFKLADTIEAQVADATARADKMTQAILAKAFRGELVLTEAELARKEGRDYEPASALLARIAATRAQTDAQPKRTRTTTGKVEPGRRKTTDRTA
jgi:type I restriction enzyme S subunit